METYLHYLKDVLGIQSVIISAKDADIHRHQVVDVLFVNVITDYRESLKNHDVAELFEKMRAAMKLDSFRAVCVDYTPKDSNSIYSDINQAYDARFVVVMKNEPLKSGELRIRGPSIWMETFNPFYLLENQGTKKLVWNDLQKIMKRLGIS